MMNDQEITPTHIRKLLQNWESIYELGRGAEAQLDVVTYKLKQLGLTDSPAGRGMALKMVLRDCIERLKPSGPLNTEDRAWRPYLVVSNRYCKGRHPELIMLDLYISQRTFYRELQNGLSRIASHLTQMEVETAVLRSARPHEVWQVPVFG